MKKTMALCLFFIICFSAVSAYGEPAVNGRSAILMEASSGEILYELNPHEPYPPASVTKIMTMLLVMEAIDRGELSYDTIVTASEHAKSMGGSTIYLDTNEQMSVEDLLKGVAVASGNDASVALAEHIGGSEEGFVNMMNERAAELGMNDTHFVNTNGLDADGHVSSAYDIAIMSRELLKHEDIFRFTTIWMDTLRDGKFQLANTNKLIRYYSGANGLKTGSTSGAMCCLSGTAKRDGMQLIAVIMGAPDSKTRFSSVTSMLDYGFANFAVIGNAAGSEVSSVAVNKGREEEVIAVVGKEYSAVVSKARKNDVVETVSLPECIDAPIDAGGELGYVAYTLDGEEIGRSTLVAKNGVAKKTPLDFFLQMTRQMMSNK